MKFTSRILAKKFTKSFILDEENIKLNTYLEFQDSNPTFHTSPKYSSSTKSRIQGINMNQFKESIQLT